MVTRTIMVSFVWAKSISLRGPRSQGGQEKPREKHWGDVFPRQMFFHVLHFAYSVPCVGLGHRLCWDPNCLQFPVWLPSYQNRHAMEENKIIWHKHSLTPLITFPASPRQTYPWQSLHSVGTVAASVLGQGRTLLLREGAGHAWIALTVCCPLPGTWYLSVVTTLAISRSTFWTCHVIDF